MRIAGGVRLGVATTVIALTLLGCSGDDDARPRSPSRSAGPSTTTVSDSTPSSDSPSTSALPTEALTGDGALSLALQLVPADAEVVVFTDLAAVKERLGYGELTGQSPTFQRFEFWELVRAEGALLTGTRLYASSSVMAIDYGWTAEDVDWEVAWSREPEACADPDGCVSEGGGYVLGLRPDLDWNVVPNSLADNGFVESGEAPELFVTENAAAPFDTVRLIPEIHGLAVGDAAFPSGEGDAPLSVADELSPLANRLGPLESAYFRADCVSLEAALGPDVVEDDLTAYFKHNDPSGLRPPVNTAVGFLGGSSATAVLQYAEADAAAADAPQRERIINTWPSLQAGEPFATIGTAHVRAERGYGLVDIDVADPSRLARRVLTDDAPWALCPASPPPK